LCTRDKKKNKKGTEKAAAQRMGVIWGSDTGYASYTDQHPDQLIAMVASPSACSPLRVSALYSHRAQASLARGEWVERLNKTDSQCVYFHGTARHKDKKGDGDGGRGGGEGAQSAFSAASAEYAELAESRAARSGSRADLDDGQGQACPQGQGGRFRTVTHIVRNELVGGRMGVDICARCTVDVGVDPPQLVLVRDLELRNADQELLRSCPSLRFIATDRPDVSLCLLYTSPSPRD
jgi:hypothetical protein